MRDRARTTARRLAVAAPLCALVGVAAWVGAAPAVPPATAGAGAGARGAASAMPPNVIVVMTDDQTVQQLEVMGRTRALLADQGTTFANSFVSFPLCCPSRATLLTGQYAHNHGVMENHPPRGGFERLRLDETLAVWLKRAGYATAQVGKVMNGYETSPVGVPPGWDEWHAMKTLDHYYGYDLLRNGELARYGSERENPDDPAEPEAYSTDVFTRIAVELVGELAPRPQPFFLWLSYNAPHSGRPEPPFGPEPPSRCMGNAKPAARHLGTLEDVPLPRPPSLGEGDVADKPPSVRNLPPLDAADLDAIHDFYRCELESLLAVDEGIERLVAALAARGELERTVLILTSDNGFFHGEHRIVGRKHRVYEEAIRVPLLIRGPGFPAGLTVDEPVSNVSLAPTILDLADAEAGLPLDERSLLPLVRRPRREHGREVLIESIRFAGVRTPRYLYAEHRRGEDAGARELYDLRRDPYEVRNVVRVPRYRDERRALRRRVRELRRCVGEECWTRPRVRMRVSPPARPKARRAPRRRGGEECEGRIRIAVGGRDRGRIRVVEFRLRRRALRFDRRAPYRVAIPARRLAGRGKRITANAVLIDGRELTLRRTVRC